MHFWISLDIKFHFEQTILNFGTKFPKNDISSQKREKVDITIEFCMFGLVWVPNISLNWQFFFDQICPTRVLPVSNKPTKNYHRILHIRIKLCIRFQLKLIILDFWTKFPEKGYFQSKADTMNATIDFFIFELV